MVIKQIQALTAIIISILLFSCQEDPLGEFPATYYFDGIERIDSQMYVLESVFDFTLPQDVKGSIKDSLSNKFINTEQGHYFDKITFESQDSVLLLSQTGNERRKHYYYNGVERISLSNTVDIYETFRYDEPSKTVRQPMALIFKSRFLSSSNTVKIRYTTLGRGLDDIEKVAEFGFYGSLFNVKNDSMGILIYDLVYKME